METLTELIPRFRELGRREAVRHLSDYSSRVMTYQDLHGLIGVCAGYLDERGLTRGDRVLLQAENSAEWVALFWACVARGIVVVPVDFNFTPELASRIRADCDARLTVESKILEQLRERGTQTAFHDFSITASSPDDVVEILYTSGTTGEPHGIVHRHRNICANLEPFRNEISKYGRWAAPFQPIRILELLPLSHMFGQSMGLFVPVFLEGAVAFTSEIRPTEIVRVVRDNRISVIVAVPRILEVLRNDIRRQIPAASSLAPPHMRGLPDVAARWWKYRRVHARFGWKFWAFVVGGARVDPELEEFWSRMGYGVIQGYGLTEASPVVAVNHPFSSKRGSLGKAVPGQEVRIAPDGEILVRGASIAAAVDADGWLHTGDLGEMDSEGRLYFHGRKKDVIVTPDGLNVSPDDVETALRQIPEIKDCAVVGVGDQVHAALILRNTNAARAEIENWIRLANERLEAHQRIRNWSIWPLADFPRTASTMKVKRSAVAAEISAGSNKDTNIPDPSAMSSLERVELLTELEERHGIEIDEAAFSRAITPEDMKRFMANPVPAQAASPLSTWPMSWPIRALRSAFQRCVPIPLFRWRLPLTVVGVENLSGVDSPVIFAANHASDLDTPAVFTALPAAWRRRLAPAMRANYFESGWKFHVQYLLARALYNTYPLPQEIAGTRRALEFTAELLRRGYCPLVFPEGRRTRDGALQNFRPGVGMMAIQLHVPVAPLRIEGMFEIYSAHDSWPKTGPVKVFIGMPIRFPAGTPFDEAAQIIRTAISNLGTERKFTK